MKRKELGYGSVNQGTSSRTKRGSVSSRHETSSDAFDDLRKASDEASARGNEYKRGDKVGGLGDNTTEEKGSTELSSEGHSLIYALITGLVGIISLELVFTNKGVQGRINADVRSKAKN